MRKFAGLTAALTGATWIVPWPAHAHLVQTGFGTFYDGMVHLAITPEDLLVVVGLGLLAGMCGAAASRAALVALPAGWLIGGAAGMWWPAAGPPPVLTTVTFGAVGVLVALDRALPRLLVVALAGAAGLVHGAANGTTLAAAGMDWLGLVGVGTAVFFAATVLPALVVSLRAQWTRIAVRVAGSWIAAAGLLMLGWLSRGQG